eukprot:2679257-Amphidinium_carterae.1
MQAAARRYTVISTECGAARQQRDAASQEQPSPPKGKAGKGKGNNTQNDGKGKGNAMQNDEEPWKQVKGRRDKKDERKKTDEDSSTATPPRLSLHPNDWSVPVRDEFQVGQSAVLLAPTPQVADQWGKLAKNSDKPVAIITIAPMHNAKTTNRITFRVQRGEGKNATDSLLDGFMNQFSERPVLHNYRLKTITAKKSDLATTVLSFYAAKQFVTSWDKIKNLKNTQAMNEYLKPCGLSAVDVFRVQTIPGSITGLVRVPATSVRKFMLHEDIEISCSVVGDNGKTFKMMWDSDLSTVTEARMRYKHVPGYAGVAQTARGLGIRIEASSFEVAARMVGKPVGTIYKIAGVPIHLGAEEVEDIAMDIGWDASVVPNSRRAFKGAATWLLRASSSPDEVAISMKFETGELARMQITEFVKHRVATDDPDPRPAPSTWAEVARRTLGVSKPQDQRSPPPVRWADQESLPSPEQTDDEEDDDMEEDDEDQDYEESAPNVNWKHNPNRDNATDDDEQDNDDNEEDDNDDDMMPLCQLERPGARKEIRKRAGESIDNRANGPVKRNRPTSNARVDSLEQNLNAMQTQMNQLMSMMQQVLPPVQQEISAPTSPAPVAMVGTIPLIPQHTDLFKWEDVTDDGSCMWQSACVQEKDWPQGYTPEVGHEYKTTKLKEMRIRREELARVWMCKPASVQSAIKDWTPTSAWSDIRVHLSLAYMANTVVVIHDEDQGVLRLVCPFGAWTPQSTIWYFRYTETHCTPGRCVNFSALLEQLAAIPLAPWNPRAVDRKRGADLVPMYSYQAEVNQEGFHKRRGGKEEGMTADDGDLSEAETALPDCPSIHSDANCDENESDIHDTDTDSDEEFENFCIPLDHVCPDFSQRDVTHVYSSNVGGWKTNGRVLLDNMPESESFVLCVQETALTKDAQHGLRAALKDRHMHAVFGHPTPWKRTTKGALRTGKAQVPGLAVFASQTISILPVGCKTAAGNRWFNSGRCMLVQIGSGDKAFLCMNIYAPSGANAKQLRQEFLHDMCDEICSWDVPNMIVCGDFNQIPFNTPLCGELLVRQWQLPCFRTPDRTIVTYRSGQSESWIDAFVISPSVAQAVYHQDVYWFPKMQHATLHLSIVCDLMLAHPKVQHAPIVVPGPRTNVSPVDWPALEASIRTQHSAHDPSQESLQSHVDDLWVEFLSACETELRSCHEVQESGRRCGSSVLGKEQTFAPARPHKLCPSENLTGKLYMFAHLLSQLHDHESQYSREEVATMVPTISNELGWTPERVWAVTHNEDGGVAEIVKAARAQEVSSTRKAIRQWHKRFVDERKRPSKSLYRWLKGKRVHPHLAVRTETGLALGYQDFFQELEKHWVEIMREDPVNDMCMLHEWLALNPNGDTALPGGVTDLRKIVKNLAKGSASGMDGWSNEAVRCLSDGALRVLLVLFEIIERSRTWPTSLCTVRTQMIPKTEEPTPTVESLRPISITSVWFRLWGKFRLAQLDPTVHEQLDSALCLGIPGRQTNDKMCELTAQIEQAISGDSPVFMLALDASKCFDRINHVSVLEAGRECNIPIPILGVLGSFYMSVNRFMSSASHISSNGIHPTNGIPQGCAWSALLTNCLTHQWAKKIRDCNARPISGLDDRLIVAGDLQTLQEAANASHKWDAQNKWRINAQKCCFLSAPFDASSFVMVGSERLNAQGAMRLLGTSVCTKYLEGRKLQKTRTKCACSTAERLEVMNIPVTTAQHVVGTVVGPQFVYGPMTHEVPKYQIHQLKMQVKRACHLYRRRNNWNALSAVVAKAHRIDPLSIVRYNHLRCMIRAIRHSVTLREALQRWEPQPDNAVPRGPMEVWRRMLAELRLRVSTTTWIMTHDDLAFEPICLLDASWPQVLHDLRVSLRHACAHAAAQQRARLADIPACDLNATRSIFTSRADIPCLAELIALTTDSAWTEYMRNRCNLGTTDKCPWCHEVESLEHVLYHCPNWDHLRDTRCGNIRCLLEFSPATSQAGWCPAAASPEMRSKWSVFQLALAALWHARQVAYHDMHAPSALLREDCSHRCGLVPLPPSFNRLRK